jgi:hypothetical protein
MIKSVVKVGFGFDHSDSQFMVLSTVKQMHPTVTAETNMPE